MTWGWTHEPWCQCKHLQTPFGRCWQAGIAAEDREKEMVREDTIAMYRAWTSNVPTLPPTQASGRSDVPSQAPVKSKRSEKLSAS